MTTIRQLAALTSLERMLLVQALILLALVRFSLATFGWRRTQAWLEGLSMAPSSPFHLLESRAYVWTVERIVNAAARSWCISATCLPRALVTCTLLRRNGITATLKFGVRRQSAGIEAHAWVETVHAKLRTANRSAGYAPLEAPNNRHVA